MPDVSTLAVFALAALALIVIPGPAVLYVITRSIDQGRAAGLVSVLGIAVGGLVHVAAATAGLSALLATSATAFQAVKYVGAAYLIYLGIRRLMTPAETSAGETVDRKPLGRIFIQGIVVNILNPKTALFFLAFLPQFADPARGSLPVQIAVLGVTFVLIAILSDGTYALIASSMRRVLRDSKRFGSVRRYVAGTIFISLGVAAAFSGHSRTAD
jgi:threonine/homoserine/homoserine lactone efflux protein